MTKSQPFSNKNNGGPLSETRTSTTPVVDATANKEWKLNFDALSPPAVGSLDVMIELSTTKPSAEKRSKEEERRLRRREQNRRAAIKSRKRKKMRMASLQERVAQLEARNRALAQKLGIAQRENEALKAEERLCFEKLARPAHLPCMGSPCSPALSALDAMPGLDVLDLGAPFVKAGSRVQQDTSSPAFAVSSSSQEDVESVDSLSVRSVSSMFAHDACAKKDTAATATLDFASTALSDKPWSVQFKPHPKAELVSLGGGIKDEDEQGLLAPKKNGSGAAGAKRLKLSEVAASATADSLGNEEDEAAAWDLDPIISIGTAVTVW